MNFKLIYILLIFCLCAPVITLDNLPKETYQRDKYNYLIVNIYLKISDILQGFK